MARPPSYVTKKEFDAVKKEIFKVLNEFSKIFKKWDKALSAEPTKHRKRKL